MATQLKDTCPTQILNLQAKLRKICLNHSLGYNVSIYDYVYENKSVCQGMRSACLILNVGLVDKDLFIPLKRE